MMKVCFTFPNTFGFFFYDYCNVLLVWEQADNKKSAPISRAAIWFVRKTSETAAGSNVRIKRVEYPQIARYMLIIYS